MVRDGQKNCGTILCYNEMKSQKNYQTILCYNQMKYEAILWCNQMKLQVHSIEEVAHELSPQSRKIGCQLHNLTP